MEWFSIGAILSAVAFLSILILKGDDKMSVMKGITKDISVAMLANTMYSSLIGAQAISVE